MIEVELVAITEPIEARGPGFSYYEPHSSLQLRYKKNGAVVQDGFYKLTQDGSSESKPCSIVSGQVRGAEWVNVSGPLFLV